MNEHRPMPSHPEAERELLGWLMLGRDDTSEVFALLKPDDFHDARHVRVFEAMADLHRERKVIDLITVSSLMHSLGTMPYLAASGGDAYLSELTIGCSYFSTEQQLEHAGMVLDAARKRGIILASAEMAERAYRGDATSAQIVAMPRCPAICARSSMRRYSVSRRHTAGQYMSVSLLPG